MRRSLRLRLILGGLAAILIALTIAGLGLTVLFERHVARNVAEDLDVYLKQLIAGLDVDADGRLIVTRPPGDPRFAEPLSGLYWQIGDDHRLVRSRSLWDTTLSLPEDDPPAGEVHHHRVAGPADSRLLLAERRVSLTIGGQETPVRVAVAADLARVTAAKSAFAGELFIALGLLGLVLALATSVQVALGLRPLDLLRRGVVDIRAGKRPRLPAAAPSEVGPLVDELNALLAVQEQEVERSRGRAADLAHGLKTPLAALAADAGRLRAQGESAIAIDIEAATEAMRRHVDRELARARIRSPQRGTDMATPLLPLVRSLIATLARTPQGAGVTFATGIAEDAIVPFDRTDLAEVLGNLLENAARHARSKVRIAAETIARIVVEDDGPGIDSAVLAAVLARGGRLDQRGSAGLGLAIVQDVLEAYGWRLALEKSDLGGVKAVMLPSRSSEGETWVRVGFSASTIAEGKEHGHP